MKKTIKITEEQKARLKEMLFPNGSDSADDMREYHGSFVTADGYVNDTDGGAEPLTGDRFSHMMCKNYPWGIGYYRGAVARPVWESEMSDLYNQEDSNGDGVEDSYNHADANLEQFGDSNEIPGEVKTYLDKLVNALKGANLNPKKQLMVLNYIIDNAGLNNIPFSYKKETMKKIAAKK
ncbi:MAG: hypothetical protein J6X18_09015 [Bacteroidales bacterium]|nr:hypothetical protein [Bacteroidales bacterium]